MHEEKPLRLIGGEENNLGVLLHQSVPWDCLWFKTKLKTKIMLSWCILLSHQNGRNIMFSYTRSLLVPITKYTQESVVRVWNPVDFFYFKMKWTCSYYKKIKRLKTKTEKKFFFLKKDEIVYFWEICYVGMYIGTC